MKKFLLFELLAVAYFFNPVTAQQCTPGTLACVDTLSSDIAVVSASGTYNFGDTCIWVCSGNTVTLVDNPLGPHGFNNVYVEAGATVNISSAINGVIAKAGAIINLLPGSSGTNVTCEPGVIITQNGSPWSGTCLCPQVIFDYSYTPLESCAATGIGQDRQEISLQCFPNPANGIVTIKFNGITHNDEIAINNVFGVELSSFVPSGEQITINSSGLSAGVFFITARKAGRAVIVKKLVISK